MRCLTLKPVDRRLFSSLLLSLFAALFMFQPTAGAAEDKPAWVQAMRKVHAGFKGRKGTFAHFGDSITYSMPFWASLQSKPRLGADDFKLSRQRVLKYMHQDCWRKWKGAEFGNYSGKTVAWALKGVDRWLKKLNPETVLIMFGTNDLRNVSAEKYEKRLRELIGRCLANSSVVILSTIPPRSGQLKKSKEFAIIARKLSREMKLPLCDFFAEVLKRRPDDWDGSLPRFKEHKTYQVPTLIAGDGVHPSNPARWQRDFSEKGLRHHGYNLRSYITLKIYAEVIEQVFSASSNTSASGKAESVVPFETWWPRAPLLARSTGKVIKVSTVNELFKAVAEVKAGENIEIAPGHYRLKRRLGIKTDRVTLRGISGKRNDVVLDGGGIGELMAFTACKDVTVADLTIQNVKWNGFKIDSQTGVQRLRIYNCVIHNVWQRGVKGVGVPVTNRQKMRPTNCRVEYCLFYNDRPKRYQDDEADTPQNFKGNYIGAIDVMFASGWTISDNVFLNIQGRTREGRGAVFLWHETLKCVVERNIIIDCDKGISLGNSFLPKKRGITLHARKCLVRNNMVTRAPEAGLLAAHTADCRFLHNTVHDPRNALKRLVRVLGDASGLQVAGNILSGPAPRIPEGKNITFKHNLIKNLNDSFVDPGKGNLHLKTSLADVVNKAAKTPEIVDDIDRRKRQDQPDIGAHEYSGK
jgi:lysophospholipase L1-like esterase